MWTRTCKIRMSELIRLLFRTVRNEHSLAVTAIEVKVLLLTGQLTEIKNCFELNAVLVFYQVWMKPCSISCLSTVASPLHLKRPPRHFPIGLKLEIATTLWRCETIIRFYSCTSRSITKTIHDFQKFVGYFGRKNRSRQTIKLPSQDLVHLCIIR